MKKTIYRNENEALAYYNDMLNECYPEVEICGYKYQTAVALETDKVFGIGCRLKS